VRILSLALLLAVVSGCAYREPRRANLDTAPPNAPVFATRFVDCHTTNPNPPNKEAVLAELRACHILTPKTKVLSMRWNRRERQWDIALLHPAGLRTYWTTDATAWRIDGGSRIATVPVNASNDTSSLPWSTPKLYDANSQ